MLRSYRINSYDKLTATVGFGQWTHLDFSTGKTDNLYIQFVFQLIYSPPDMPQGLRRGSVFIGSAWGVENAC
jgi:hypothetical protein